MGHSIYVKDFETCIVCHIKLGARRKFTCSKECFKKYRTIYAKYLARGLSGKDAKVNTLKDLCL